MTDPYGVNLLPACNEWVYDTLPHRAARAGESVQQPQNRYAQGANLRTDYSLAIDQLQATYPGCETVSLVCAWFGDSTDVTQCAIYPSTTFIGGTSSVFASGAWATENWQCSGLTQASAGLIPISELPNGSFVYGGTPSDTSLVRCIQDLKSRGFRVTFYPFILMDCAGYPWRGRITFNGADISAAATNAVQGWLGSAAPSQFARDTTNLTVGYTGSPTDWTFRRMILHYANLCVIAGGVDLFLIGSEFRGLETIRGPAWTKAGATQADGTVTWDYPFVAGLIQLAADVRGIFDSAGLTKDTGNLHNLIAYSPDWSDWMGFQHPGANGQWPHLDQLFASPNIDIVSFDNYLPLSDWTTGSGGLDALHWTDPVPTSWPATAATMNGLGMTGAPFLASKPYLKANIEGGEKFFWFYNDGTNLGRGLDPNGSALNVSCPEGDRVAQSRTPYQPNQQILANKMLRWWWSNPHQAVYDAGDGQGYVPHGPTTKWVPQSKPITFAEYGFPTCDKAPNQPNVFYDPKSSESFTPYWSAWESAEGAIYRPVRDDTLASLARDAVVEYWTVDGHNTVSAAGVKMIEPTFMSVWNWDARPFPVFPQSNYWGDAPNWRAGTWVGGKGPSEPPGLQDAAPIGTYEWLFPTALGAGWSVTYRPVFSTGTAAHVSGRESRGARNAAPLWQITMSFEVLTDTIRNDLQGIVGVFDTMAGQAAPFLVAVPSALGIANPSALDFGLASLAADRLDDHGLASDPVGLMYDYGAASDPLSAIPCRFGDDDLDVEGFAQHLYQIQSLTLEMVR